MGKRTHAPVRTADLATVEEISPIMDKALRPDHHLKQKIEEGLTAAMGDAKCLVDVSKGFGGNLHVVVVSRVFDQFSSEVEKQQHVWSLIKGLKLGKKSEMKISLVVPFSPGELK